MSRAQNMTKTRLWVMFLLLNRIHCSQTVHKIYHQSKKRQCTGLMGKGNRNFHVKKDGQDSKHDLNNDHSHQPGQSIPDFSGLALPAGSEIKRGDCDEDCKRKPAMDEDNRL